MTAIDIGLLQRVLGDELRRVRKQRGWTRKELNDRLGQMARALQTLATYELGTRAMSVTNLFIICAALDVLPQVIIARVYDRLNPDHVPAGGITVELRELIRCHRPAIQPLRGWAIRVLADDPHLRTRFLDPVALIPLAHLCDLSLPDLTQELRTLPGTQLHS